MTVRQQGFADPPVDYRHERLMAEVAQHLDGCRARRYAIRGLLRARLSPKAR
jgi:hypothetical protein